MSLFGGCHLCDFLPYRYHTHLHTHARTHGPDDPVVGLGTWSSHPLYNTDTHPGIRGQHTRVRGPDTTPRKRTPSTRVEDSRRPVSCSYTTTDACKCSCPLAPDPHPGCHSFDTRNNKAHGSRHSHTSPSTELRLFTWAHGHTNSTTQAHSCRTHTRDSFVRYVVIRKTLPVTPKQPQQPGRLLSLSRSRSHTHCPDTQ